MKPSRGGLGLLIQESPDEAAGVYVQEVVQNQAAFIDGRIKSGDKILAINHTSTVGANQDTVFKLLQACQGKVVLTVQHCENFSTPQTAMENFSKPPGVYPPSQPHIPNRDPPPYPSPFPSYLPDPQPGAMWGAMPSPPHPHQSGEGK